MTPDYDVFVSHASEDKARFVESFVAALEERGLRVWYDANEIRFGDDFRRRMDDGLARSRFGVVVLSPNFFKFWPEAELSALWNQEATFGGTRILPIRLELDHATMTARSPLLAARAALGWELGVRELAAQVEDRLRDAPAIPRKARSRVYNLPVRRTQKLFGRETDLTRLEAMLAPGASVRVAASIEGLAGVGKTELALHLVDRLSASDRRASRREAIRCSSSSPTWSAGRGRASRDLCRAVRKWRSWLPQGIATWPDGRSRISSSKRCRRRRRATFSSPPPNAICPARPEPPTCCATSTATRWPSSWPAPTCGSFPS